MRCLARPLYVRPSRSPVYKHMSAKKARASIAALKKRRLKMQRALRRFEDAEEDRPLSEIPSSAPKRPALSHASRLRCHCYFTSRATAVQCGAAKSSFDQTRAVPTPNALKTPAHMSQAKPHDAPWLSNASPLAKTKLKRRVGRPSVGLVVAVRRC